MEAELLALAKEYFYILIIAGGTLVFAGALFNWEWLCHLPPNKLNFLRIFVEEVHGEKAWCKVERFLTGCIGLVLIGCGIFYWLYLPK